MGFCTREHVVDNDYRLERNRNQNADTVYLDQKHRLHGKRVSLVECHDATGSATDTVPDRLDPQRVGPRVRSMPPRERRAMSEDLYRCICHTCGTERLVEGLEDAQAFFNDHAERAHEVELLNQQSRRRRYPEPDSDAAVENGDETSDTDGAVDADETDDTNDSAGSDGA